MSKQKVHKVNIESLQNATAAYEAFKTAKAGRKLTVNELFQDYKTRFLERDQTLAESIRKKYLDSDGDEIKIRDFPDEVQQQILSGTIESKAYILDDFF